MTSKKKMKSLLTTAGIIAGSVCVLLAIACYSYIYVPSGIARNPELAFERSLQREFYWGAKEKETFEDPQTLKLCRAIKRRDSAKIRRLIKAGADVNAKGRGGVPLLLWTFPAGEDMMDCLLSNGADPNFVCDEKIVSASHGMNDVLLFSNRAILDETLLYSALKKKLNGERYFDNYPSLLLKYGADPNLGKASLLAVAASSKRTREDFFKLLEAGAEINPASEPYPVVECLGYEQEIYLLEHGAIYDVNTPQGSLLQRRVYELTETREGRLTPMSDETRENIEKTRAWLEEHGVGFEEEAVKIETDGGDETLENADSNADD